MISDPHNGENGSAESTEALLGERGEGSRVRLLEGDRGVDVALNDEPREGLGRRRFTVPSVTAEAGAVVERQLLLAGGGRWRSRSVRRVLWILAAGVFVVGVFGGALGGAYLYHTNQEAEWQMELDATESRLASVGEQKDQLARDKTLALQRIEDKSREVDRLSTLADKALDQLNTSFDETRALRGELAVLQERYERLLAVRWSELPKLIPVPLRQTVAGRKLKWFLVTLGGLLSTPEPALVPAARAD